MPRMVDLIRASAVPANLMQAAARGALSVPAPEMIEILVHLAIHNKVFGEQARLTLAGWDEHASKQAASDPKTSREVLDYLMATENLRPALLPSLLDNPAVGEESLLVFAASGSRELVKAMLGSSRVKASPQVLNVLKSNPHVTANESAGIEALLAASAFDTAAAADEVLEPSVAGETDSPDEVLDEELTPYLNEQCQGNCSRGRKAVPADRRSV